MKKEKAWKAHFIRVMYEYYRFSPSICEKIWNNADKLLHHEQLELIRTFSGEKVERLIDVVAACSKDKTAVKALKIMAEHDLRYGWTISKIPALEKLSKTSLSSLAEMIEQVALPANAKALYKFSIDRKLDLFGFNKLLAQQGKQQAGLKKEQQERLEKSIERFFDNCPGFEKIYNEVHTTALSIEVDEKRQGVFVAKEQ